MGEQVTDISKMLKEVVLEMRTMQETIDVQRTEIANLNRNVQKLQKENRDLRSCLAKYEKPEKNSENSSTPPSKEKMKDEVIRRTKTLRKQSGLKPGGQLGHQCHRKEISSNPNFVEDCMSDYCRGCGRDLSNIEGELDYITQVVDLPVIAPIVTEYRHYKKVCTCGCCNDYKPRNRGNQVTFGKNIRAIVTYLSVVQCIPYGRLASMM